LAYGANWDELEVMIRRQRSHTVIELTQQCNLRCKYCTFGGGFKDHRMHSPKIMSEEIVEQAILAAIESGTEMEELSIGFYGGEPLISFDLLKHAVAFARLHSAGKALRFSVTTNATLIEKKTAEFLRDNDFNILVSIDGPKYMHDTYRVYADGRGSYQWAIRGLKNLLEIYPSEMHKHIGLNMVIPSIGWVKQLHELWNDEKWLPRGIRAQVSVMDPPDGLLPPPPPDSTKWDDIRKYWLESTKAEIQDASSIYSNIFDRMFAIIHQRPTFTGFRNSFFPNGCCIPAVRKIYVSVDGDYLICERAHGCPPIGNLRSGVDINKVKQIVDEYVTNSYNECRNCLAISNCTLCFDQAFESGKFSHERKRLFCENERATIVRSFPDYCRLCKEQTQRVKVWEDIQIV